MKITHDSVKSDSDHPATSREQVIKMLLLLKVNEAF